MADQTTDHLSGAEAALQAVLWKRGWNHLTASLGGSQLHGDLFAALEAAEPFFATYYEDKGRASSDLAGAYHDQALALTRAEETIAEFRRHTTSNAVADAITENAELRMRAEKAERDLAAAEDKGRSEERERLRGGIAERLKERIRTERIWQSKATPGLGAARANARVRALEQITDEIDQILAALDSDQEGQSVSQSSHLPESHPSSPNRNRDQEAGNG